MRPEAPCLAPMFRSEAQLAILGEVFCGTRPYTISELTKRAGTNIATASREINLLAECGVIDVVSGPGRSKLISPAADLPYAADLRRILAHTYGLLPRLRALLAEHQPEVEQMWVFGSWARRYRGERGHFPHDVDLVVVTAASPLELGMRWRSIGRDLSIELNPIYRHPDDFSLDDAPWGGTPMIEVVPGGE